MATRSLIGMAQKDTSQIRYIYCHWNGAPEDNGRILLNHYQDPEKIKSLLDLGDISTLHPKLVPVGNHTFDSPEDGVVVAYHRDRGEVLKSYIAYSEGQFVSTDYIDIIIGGMVDYIYLFKEGSWYYFKGGSFVLLEL